MTPLPGNPRNPRVSAQKLYVHGLLHDFGTVALIIFGKQLDLRVFTMNLAHVLGLLFIKSYMFMVFTMNFAHLLVLFSIKSRRWPKAVQGAQRDPTGTSGRP